VGNNSYARLYIFKGRRALKRKDSVLQKILPYCQEKEKVIKKKEGILHKRGPIYKRKGEKVYLRDVHNEVSREGENRGRRTHLGTGEEGVLNCGEKGVLESTCCTGSTGRLTEREGSVFRNSGERLTSSLVHASDVPASRNRGKSVAEERRKVDIKRGERTSTDHRAVGKARCRVVSPSREGREFGRDGIT